MSCGDALRRGSFRLGRHRPNWCWFVSRFLRRLPRMIPGPIRVEPVVLEGEHVRLEPLSLSHLDGLCEIGIVEELWRWIPTQVTTREQMKAYVELALNERANGVSMPFAQIERAS